MAIWTVSFSEGTTLVLFPVKSRGDLCRVVLSIAPFWMSGMDEAVRASSDVSFAWNASLSVARPVGGEPFALQLYLFGLPSQQMRR